MTKKVRDAGCGILVKKERKFGIRASPHPAAGPLKCAGCVGGAVVWGSEFPSRLCDPFPPQLKV